MPTGAAYLPKVSGLFQRVPKLYGLRISASGLMMAGGSGH